MRTITLLSSTAIAFCVALFVLVTSQSTQAGAVDTGAEVTAADKVPTAFNKKPAAGTKAKCPVMKHPFIVHDKTEHSTYKGKHYVFCCQGCKERFDADPPSFLK